LFSLSWSNHIQVKIDGEVGYLTQPLLHDGTADISIFVKKMNFYTTNSAHVNLGKKKASWFDIIIKPGLIFVKRYIVLKGFLDAFPGFVIAILSALYIFIDSAKLKEAEYSNKLKTEVTTK